jgi:nucleoside-diphosphate-sugar epimerase
VRDETYWNPASPEVAYERTKRDAHLVARELAAAGAPVRIAIPGGIYGFGDESEMSTLIRLFVLWGAPIGYMPEVVQSLVNVDDCVDGLVRIAEQGVDGGEYLLCADAVNFREWFEEITAAAGRRPPYAYLPTGAVRGLAGVARRVLPLLDRDPTAVDETVAMATRHLAYTGDRARKELGWNPRSLRQGMVELALAIRADESERRASRAGDTG